MGHTRTLALVACISCVSARALKPPPAPYTPPAPPAPRYRSGNLQGAAAAAPSHPRSSGSQTRQRIIGSLQDLVLCTTLGRAGVPNNVIFS